VIIVFLVSYIGALNANKDSQTIGQNIESTTLNDILDPELALNKGIDGYVTIEYATKGESIEINKGNPTTIELLLTYITHSEKQQTTTISIDPDSAVGLTIEKQLNKSGQTIRLNDFVSYDPQGQVVLTSGKTEVIKMIINMPSETPDVQIPIGPVGITAKVPIIHRGGGLRINVH
jgi:hypothetical protein